MFTSQQGEGHHRHPVAFNIYLAVIARASSPPGNEPVRYSDHEAIIKHDYLEYDHLKHDDEPSDQRVADHLVHATHNDNFGPPSHTRTVRTLRRRDARTHLCMRPTARPRRLEGEAHKIVQGGFGSTAPADRLS